MPTTAHPEVARIRALYPAWNASRVLSALGHPGYGVAFALEVLDVMDATGCDAFTAKTRVYASRGIQ